MTQDPHNQGPARTGGTLVNDGAPGYASAGVPGVQVQLPGRPVGQVGSAPMAQPHAQAAPQPQAQHQPQNPQAMPSAPPAAAPARAADARNDELMTGGKRTVYEFTGEFSEENREGGKHKTFFGDQAELSLADGQAHVRETNLKRNSMGWVVGVVVVLLAGGLFAALTLLNKPKEASAADEEDPGMSAPAAAASPEPETPVAPAAAEGETGDAAPAEAEAAEAEPSPPAEPEAKAEAPKAEAPKAEAPKAEAPKTEAPKTTTTKKKKKSTSSSSSGSGSGSTTTPTKKKPLAITPSSGPRETKKFGNLPQP